jgi:hypothetical protein
MGVAGSGSRRSSLGSRRSDGLDVGLLSPGRVSPATTFEFGLSRSLDTSRNRRTSALTVAFPREFCCLEGLDGTVDADGRRCFAVPLTVLANHDPSAIRSLRDVGVVHLPHCSQLLLTRTSRWRDTNDSRCLPLGAKAGPVRREHFAKGECPIPHCRERDRSFFSPDCRSRRVQLMDDPSSTLPVTRPPFSRQRERKVGARATRGWPICDRETKRPCFHRNPHAVATKSSSLPAMPEDQAHGPAPRSTPHRPEPGPWRGRAASGKCSPGVASRHHSSRISTLAEIRGVRTTRKISSENLVLHCEERDR